MFEKTHGQKWSILHLWEQLGAECDPSQSRFGALAGWLAGAGWQAVTGYLACRS